MSAYEILFIKVFSKHGKFFKFPWLIFKCKGEIPV